MDKDIRSYVMLFPIEHIFLQFLISHSLFLQLYFYIWLLHSTETLMTSMDASENQLNLLTSPYFSYQSVSCRTDYQEDGLTYEISFSVNSANNLFSTQRVCQIIRPASCRISDVRFYDAFFWHLDSLIFLIIHLW